MKKITFLLFAFIFNISFGQNDVKTINNELPIYEGVISVDSTSKKEMYSLLKEWVVKSYNSAKDVIQLDTEDKIIIKGLNTYDIMIKTGLSGVPVNHISKYTLTLSIKDNRFKYLLEVISVKANISNAQEILYTVLLEDDLKKPNGKPFKKKVLDRLLDQKKQHIEQIEAFKNSITQSLSKLSEKEKKDDW